MKLLNSDNLRALGYLQSLLPRLFVTTNIKTIIFPIWKQMQSIQLSFSIKPPIVKLMKNLDKVLINLANLTT